MAYAEPIVVKESAEDLKRLYTKSANHIRPRLKMLQYISKGIYSMDALAAKTGSSRNAIACWKRTYKTGGLMALCADKRGGDFRSGIDAADKEKIAVRLSEPKDAFTSFGQAQAWINEELGMNKQYHAINKYLKRNFGASLKVGRKSHVKKDQTAVAVFKKPGANH